MLVERSKVFFLLCGGLFLSKFCVPPLVFTRETEGNVFSESIELDSKNTAKVKNSIDKLYSGFIYLS